MKSLFRGIVLETAPFGFKEETGSWDIELGVPDKQSISSLNNYVYGVIKVFLSAFEKLCQPIDIHYKIINFNLDRKIEYTRARNVTALLKIIAPAGAFVSNQNTGFWSCYWVWAPNAQV